MAGMGVPELRKQRCMCGAGHLSSRRFEVFAAIADGLRAREIAERLHVTVDTVNAHIRTIYYLAEVRAREDLLKAAIAQGLLEISPDASLKTTGKTCLWPRSQWPRP